PVAIDDAASTAEDTAVTFSITGNDSDPDGSIDPATVVVTGGPANGSLVVNANGTVTYTPDPDYNGPDSFTYTVEDNDGLVSNEATVNLTVNPAPEPNDPPTADPVLTTATLFMAGETLPHGETVSDSFVLYRGFNVGGGVDPGETTPTVREGSPASDPTLGGEDVETAEADLTFTLRTLPDTGTLYMRGGDSGSFSAASAGDTFTTEAEFYWVAGTADIGSGTSTSVDFGSGTSWPGIQAAASGFSGSSSAALTYQSQGLGVRSTGGTAQNEVSEQLGFREGSSEAIHLYFTDSPATGATIDIGRLITNEESGEVGRVTAYLGGQKVGSWTFSGRDGATLDGASVNYDIGGSNGSFTLPAGIVFDRLKFEATEYADGFTRSGDSTDSSDYFLSGISYTAMPSARFTYDATDGNANTSPAVQVLINPPAMATAPIALDLDGDGVEYLSREAGVVFTDQATGEAVNSAWVAGDDGLLVVDANDSGTVDEAREYVFTEWSESAETDMEAVAEVFDSNQNQVLDAGDEAWSQFAVWQDADSDGVTDAGELASLDELGVESIALTYHDDSEAAGAADGDVKIFGQSEVTWKDGEVTVAEDTSFAINVADLLPESDASERIDAYLQASFDGANTIVEVSRSGGFTGEAGAAAQVDQTITFEGVDLVGGLEGSDAIQAMIDAGKLNVDP
ncbi:MAG: Ig-like domain-containing protein, partial [Pseudohaliea sp.]